MESLRAGAETEDFALIGFEDFELQAIVIEFLARFRNVAGELIEQARDRGGTRFRRIALPFDAEKILQLFNTGAAAENHAAIVFADNIGSGMAVLFADVADNFLD